MGGGGGAKLKNRLNPDVPVILERVCLSVRRHTSCVHRSGYGSLGERARERGGTQVCLPTPGGQRAQVDLQIAPMYSHALSLSFAPSRSL